MATGAAENLVEFYVIDKNEGKPYAWYDFPVFGQGRLLRPDGGPETGGLSEILILRLPRNHSEEKARDDHRRILSFSTRSSP